MLSLWHLLLLLFAMETAPNPDDEPGEEEEETEEEEREESAGGDEEVRDAEKMALSREAGKWRKKFRAAEARIAELEEADLSEPFREARLENAFLHAVMERGYPLDLNTAWDLLHVRGFIDTVTLNGDGQVDGMSDAVDKLLDRYPWLSDELPESDEEDDDSDRPRRTALPPRKRAGTAAGPSKTQLQDRFPSLMKRR